MQEIPKSEKKIYIYIRIVPILSTWDMAHENNIRITSQNKIANSEGISAYRLDDTAP